MDNVKIAKEIQHIKPPEHIFKYSLKIDTEVNFKFSKN